LRPAAARVFLVAMERSWEQVVTGDGSVTLAHPVHGETCHSVEGAWTQARERYAQGCRVRERALELAEMLRDAPRGDGRARFFLLDVGTGLGLNIAAALEALDGTGVELHVTSLEIDRGVIEGALEIGVQDVPELERAHAPVRDALRRALALEDGAPVPLAGGSLRLWLRDGRDALAALDPSARFDAVFLDPFSPRVDPPLWEADCLAAIAARMAGGSMLSTYSAAVRVRARLLEAGLRVGPGARVQKKAMGTLASPDRDLPPFDARTARRLLSRAARGP
jgi:chorismate dehydratase